MLIRCKQLNLKFFAGHTTLAVNPKFTAGHIRCKQLNLKFAANHTTSAANPKFATGHTIRQRMLIRCKHLNFGNEFQIRCKQYNFNSEFEIRCRPYNFGSESQICCRTHNSVANYKFAVDNVISAVNAHSLQITRFGSDTNSL
jgi:hypothetical protein